ncbi:MAG: hypothetical protein ABWK05_07095 [Pyrobaculum sp.]
MSYLSLGWLITGTGIGGIVLTPSAHPYVPPLSVIFTMPSHNVCEGWSVYTIEASFFGWRIYVPVVHYFERGYEYANAFTLSTSPLDTMKNYIEALIWPKWVVMPAGEKRCVAKVIAVIPAPIVILTFTALYIPIYYGYRRVW